MNMKRKGKITFSVEAYTSDVVDNAIFGLRMKVHKVGFDPFNSGAYILYFTSPYAKIVSQGEEIPEYVISLSESGYSLELQG